MSNASARCVGKGEGWTSASNVWAVTPSVTLAGFALPPQALSFARDYVCFVSHTHTLFLTDRISVFLYHFLSHKSTIFHTTLVRNRHYTISHFFWTENNRRLRNNRDILGHCQCLAEFVCFVLSRRSGWHLLASATLRRMRAAVQ